MYQVLAVKCWIKCVVFSMLSFIISCGQTQSDTIYQVITFVISCDGNCVQWVYIAFLVWLGWEGFPTERFLSWDPQHEHEAVGGDDRASHPEETFYFWISSYELLPRWPRWWGIHLPSRSHRLDPWVTKSPWRRKWQTPPVVLPGKSQGFRSLADCSPWDRKSQTRLSN